MRSSSLFALLLTAVGVFAETRPISTDGRCGGELGATCLGSTFGNSCSKFGWCGSTSAFTGDGCNPHYGECKTRSLSPHGRCGFEDGPGSRENTCEGSLFGNCCSQWGYCGSGGEFCGAGCQGSFGTCNDHRSSSPKSSAASSSSSAPSSSRLPSAASTSIRSQSPTATPTSSFITLTRAASASASAFSTFTRSSTRLPTPSSSTSST